MNLYLQVDIDHEPLLRGRELKEEPHYSLLKTEVWPHKNLESTDIHTPKEVGVPSYLRLAKIQPLIEPSKGQDAHKLSKEFIPFNNSSSYYKELAYRLLKPAFP
jgi:hypothetical protein